MVSFKCFQPLWSDSSRFWAGSGAIILCFIKMMRVSFIIVCSMFLFSFVIKFGRGECSNLWHMLNFKYLWPFGSFSPIFEQVMEKLTLHLHGMIRVSYAVVARTFLFLRSWSAWRSAQTYKKLSLLGTLAVWFIFPKFLNRTRLFLSCFMIITCREECSNL